ncbi:MAG: hypothetical protein ABI867_03630 [Kofleriaceae bacterium]
MPSDPAEQLLRCLHDEATLAREVAGAKHRESIGGQRRRHPRTVRSAAGSRNGSAWRLAWLIILAIGLLLLAATRAAAAPAGDLGTRYANAISDCPDDEDGDDDGDADNDDDDDYNDNTDGASDDDEPCSKRTASDATSDTASDARVPATDPALDAPAFEALNDSDGDDDVAETDWLDEPTTSEAIHTGVTFSSTAFDDAAELRDLELRHQRPSPWGRVDLSVAWRRAWSRDPEEAKRADVLWLLATWSR